MSDIFFSSWADVGRVVLFSCITYVLLILLIRSAGKRVISKKNVSDFVITVAVGSAAATLVLAREVRLVEGAAALATFIALQFAIMSITTRSQVARRLIEGQPRLLLYRGAMIRDALLEEEVNETEVLQAIRNRGIAAIEDVFAVVLEIDGSFSVIPNADAGETALAGVGGLPRDTRE